MIPSSANGFNINAGMTTTGDNVNITIGEETHIKGALIAAGSTDENGVFQDKKVNGEAREAALGHKNLNLSTKTLTFENSTNTNYSSNSSMSIGINGNKDKVTSASTSFSTGLPSFPMRRVGTRESAKTYLN